MSKSQASNVISSNRADGLFKDLARQWATLCNKEMYRDREYTQGTGNPPRGSKPTALNKSPVQKEHWKHTEKQQQNSNNNKKGKVGCKETISRKICPKLSEGNHCGFLVS